MDKFVWCDVTDKARELLRLNIFQLFAVWERDGSTFRIPITDETELEYCLGNMYSVCIELSDQSERMRFVTVNSWNEADKITHNGHVYVRYADLSFCK